MLGCVTCMSLIKRLKLRGVIIRVTQQILNNAQAAYYQANSQVTQTQQTIAHSQTASGNMQRELDQLEQSKQQSTLESETDESQLQQIYDDRTDFQSGLEEKLQLCEELKILYEEALQARNQWNTEWETVRHQLADKQSRHTICEHQIQQAEVNLQHLSVRRDRLCTGATASH